MSRNIHRYTEEEKKFIKKNIKGTLIKDLTTMFNEQFDTLLKYSQIKSFMGNYGLSNGIDKTFKKGHKSWNKGKKGICTGGKETQYKKGHIPQNHRIVGSERITKDGYTEIKVKEPNMWNLKHRIIWRKNKGLIPKGHAVIFGDGDKQNFDINNLIIVSRHQLLILNQNNLIQDDVELTKTAVKIAKVYEKIHDRKRG